MALTALIDTNILVYAYDRRDPAKQARSLDVLMRLHEASAGWLSVKALSEFFVVVRRIPDPLTTDQALRELQRFIAVWPILSLTPEIALEAARGVRDYGFSYWDAQMWATAKLHHLDALFSEDLNVGSSVEGVALINPLDPDFDLAVWLES